MASRKVRSRGVAVAWPPGTLPLKLSRGPSCTTGGGPLDGAIGGGPNWASAADEATTSKYGVFMRNAFIFLKNILLPDPKSILPARQA